MQSLFQNIVSLNPLKKLIAATIQAQLNKYIEDIKLEELGLLGGNIVLENLELRKDVIQELMGIPLTFDLSRGFIKELRISIPWTRLTTKPIEIKFHTIEIIVVPTNNKKNDTSKKFDKVEPVSEDAADQGEGSDEKSTPSWIQSLITRVLANVSVNIENIVLKFDDGSVVLSAYLRSFSCHSADPDLGWEQRWLEPKGPYQICHKLIQAKQLTICLDKYSTSKGPNSLVGFERPLLDRMTTTVKIQLPLVIDPNFDVQNEKSKDELSLQTSQQLSAYGSGDISFDPFDVNFGWNNGIELDQSTTPLVPVHKLPFPSNCARALQGNLRCPDLDITITPFEDTNETWASPLDGWTVPQLNLVRDHNEPLTPQESPIPNVVADIYVSSAVIMSLSAHHIVMLQHLQSLFDVEEGKVEEEEEEEGEEPNIFELNEMEPTGPNNDDRGWFARFFNQTSSATDVGDVERPVDVVNENMKSSELPDNVLQERKEHRFLVLSLHVPELKFELLRHHDDDQSKLSRLDSVDSYTPVSVPVFGLGQVEVAGLHTSQHSGRSKFADNAPQAFMEFKFGGLTLDTHILSGDAFEFVDLKFQLCKCSISPASDSSIGLVVGDLTTRPSLNRSAVVHLDNHCILQCEKPPTARVINFQSNQTNDHLAAIDARLVRLSNLNESELDFISSGVSLDLQVGKVDFIWTSMFTIQLQSFMKESALLKTPSPETGSPNAHPHVEPVEIQNFPPRCLFCNLKCLGFTARYLRRDPHWSGGTQFSMEEFGTSYHLVETSGEVKKHVEEVVQFRVSKTAMASLHETVALGLFTWTDCRAHFDGVKLKSEILSGWVSLSLLVSFESLSFNLQPTQAVAIGVFVKAFFDIIDTMSAKLCVDSCLADPPCHWLRSYQLQLVRGELSGRVTSIDSVPVFASQMSLEAVSFSSSQFPLILVSKPTTSPSAFASLRVVHPSPNVFDWFSELTGYALAVEEVSRNEPEVHVVVSTSSFEIVVDEFLTALTLLSLFIATVSSVAFSSSPLTVKTVTSSRTQITLNPREFRIFPSIHIGSMVMWLSSFLFIKSPELEVNTVDEFPSSWCLDVTFECTGSSIVAVTSPYASLGRDLCKGEGGSILQVPTCSVRGTVSRAHLEDNICFVVCCSLQFDLDSTKISVLSHFLRALRPPERESSENNLLPIQKSSLLAASSFKFEVTVTQLDVSLYVGDLQSIDKTLSSQLIRLGCGGMEMSWCSQMSLQDSHIDSYRFAISELRNCDDLWYPSRQSPLQLLLCHFCENTVPESPRLQYMSGQWPRHNALTSLISKRDLLSLKIAVGSSSHQLDKVAPACSAPWPWLCSDNNDRSYWFEVNGETKSELDSEGCFQSNRPILLVKLRQSDVIVHFPTIATVASLGLQIASSVRSSSKPTRPHLRQRPRLPSVLLEVQPLRVLLPYRRRVSVESSALDALQWTFTMSASTNPSPPNSFELLGVVGPMDVAAVVWQRRSRRFRQNELHPSHRPGSLVLQGPAALFFSKVGDCYVMAEEQLFGDPFQFNIKVSDLPAEKRLSTKISIEIEASPVVVTCQPNQYAVVMALLDIITTSALAVSASQLSSGLNNATVAAKEVEGDLLEVFLFMALSFSAPEVRVTIENQNNNPLVRLRTTQVRLIGASPGASSLRVEDCSIHYYPPSSQSNQFKRAVVLFGLATSFDSSSGSQNHALEATEPLFRFDWTTANDVHSISDMVAEIRPVYFYMTPIILDALLMSSSSQVSKDNYPLLLMRPHVPNVLSTENNMVSLLGNITVKLLSRQVQFVFATTESSGPTIIVNIRHIFLNKTKQNIQCQIKHDDMKRKKRDLDEIYDLEEAEVLSRDDDDDGDGDDGDDGDDDGETSQAEDLLIIEDHDVLLTRPKVADEILINVVGLTVCLLSDYDREPTTSDGSDGGIHSLETISLDDSSLKPCTVTISLRGRAVNDVRALALFDLVIDTDDVEFSLSLNQLQVLFTVVDVFTSVGVTPIGDKKLPHPSFIAPPAPSLASKRLQLSLPLDSFSHILHANVGSTQQSLPVNTLRFGGPKIIASPSTLAETDHLKYLWVAPLLVESTSQSSGLPLPHTVCSLGRGECLTMKPFMRVAATWKYATPRVVSRLEMKQMVAPKELIRPLHTQVSGDRADVSPAVVHLCLQRLDAVSNHWIPVACLSVPIDAIDAPPVTRQLVSHDRNASSNSNGWEGWLEGRYNTWCKDNRHRQRHRFLIPAAESSLNWRLLWSCNDLTKGVTSSRTYPLAHIFPGLFSESLEVASLEDLPLMSLSWRVRAMKVDFISENGSIHDGEEGHLNDLEPLVSMAMSSVLFNVEVPSNAWIALQPPALFIKAKTEVNFHDLATLTSAPFYHGSPFFWCRGIARGPSYYATSAVSMNFGPEAEFNISTRLFHILKTFVFEFSNVFEVPKPQSGIVSTSAYEVRYSIENLSNESLWYGQQATPETLCLPRGARKGYSWRTIPSPYSFRDPQGNNLRIGLLLRFALTALGGDTPSAWSEPVRVDHEDPTTICVNTIRDQAGASVVVPLFVTIRRDALRVVVSLRGLYCVRSSVPRPLQVRWHVVSAHASSQVAATLSECSEQDAMQLLKTIGNICESGYLSSQLPVCGEDLFILAPVDSVPRHDAKICKTLRSFKPFNEVMSTLEGCCLMVQSRIEGTDWSLPAFVSPHSFSVVADGISCVANFDAPVGDKKPFPTNTPQRSVAILRSDQQPWLLLSAKSLVWDSEENSHKRAEPSWRLLDISPAVVIHNETSDTLVITLQIKRSNSLQTPTPTHEQVGDSGNSRVVEDSLMSPSPVESARTRLAAKLSHVGQHVPRSDISIETSYREPHLVVVRIPAGGHVAPDLDLNCCYTARVYSAAIVGSLGVCDRAPAAAFAAMRSLALPLVLDLSSFVHARPQDNSCESIDRRRSIKHEESVSSLVVASASSRFNIGTTADTSRTNIVCAQETFNSSGLIRSSTIGGLDCHFGPRLLLYNHLPVGLWVQVIPSSLKRSFSIQESSVRVDKAGFPSDPTIVFVPSGTTQSLPICDAFLPTEKKGSHSPRPKRDQLPESHNKSHTLSLRYGSAILKRPSGEVLLVDDDGDITDSVVIGWSIAHDIDLSKEIRNSVEKSGEGGALNPPTPSFLPIYHKMDENQQLVLPLSLTLSNSKDVDGCSGQVFGPSTFSTSDICDPFETTTNSNSRGFVVSTDGTYPFFLHIHPRLVFLNPTDHSLRCTCLGELQTQSTPFWIEIPPTIDGETDPCCLLGLLSSLDDDDDDADDLVEQRGGPIPSRGLPDNSEGGLSSLLGRFRCTGEQRKKREERRVSEHLQIKAFGTSAMFRFAVSFAASPLTVTSPAIINVLPVLRDDDSKLLRFKVSPNRTNIPNSCPCDQNISDRSVTEYRIMSASLMEQDESVFILVHLHPQPPLIIKNLLPLETDAYLDFKVDELEPYPFRLEAGGGSAECMFDAPSTPQRFWKSDPSIFRPSQMPQHKLRFRLSPSVNEVHTETCEWSYPLWVAEGVQMLAIGEMSTMIHVFYRAGCLIVMVLHPGDEAVASGIDALHRYAYRPYHSDIAAVIPSCTVRFLDDSRPSSVEADELTKSGLLLPEIVRGTVKGMVFRMQEMVPEPHSVSFADGTSFFVPEERQSHIRYIHRYSVKAENAQVDNCLAGCDLPVLLSFSTTPHQSQDGENQQSLPCLHMVLEMVAVHKRTSVLSMRYVSPKRKPDTVLPYVKLFHLALPRKVYVSAEETLLSRLTTFAKRCIEGDKVVTVRKRSVALTPEVSKWCEDVSRALVFMDVVSVSALKFTVTLRVFVPGSSLFLGLDRSPLFFRSLEMKRVFASSSHLSSEVAANYAVDTLLRSPALLGSLQLLGSPTAFVTTFAAGARDLVVLPLEALPHGPMATSRACFQGWASFFRHLSGGALSSVSGFSSSVSQNLSSLQSVVRSVGASEFRGMPRRPSFDQDGSIDSFRENLMESYREAESSSDIEVVEDDRMRRVLGNIGRGILGVASAPLAPIVGAIGFVGRTTASLSSTVRGTQSVEEGSQANTQVTTSDPLFCPLLEDLWFRAKLLPPEASLRLLVRSQVFVGCAESLPTSMILVATCTTLYLFRKELIWLQIPLKDAAFISYGGGETKINILRISDHWKHKEIRQFSIRNLSPAHRTVLTEASRSIQSIS